MSLQQILDNELSWLDDRQNEMTDRLIESCNLNSGTFNIEGVEQVGDLLVDWYSVLDASLDRINVPDWETIDSQGDINKFPLGTILQFRKRPNADRKVILNIHRDTVYAINDTFQTCQMIDGRTLNGPGVADAKGGILVMLYGLRAFEQLDIAKEIGWEVIINPDEEIGSPGSTKFLKSRAPTADFGLMFEPAYPDGTMITWRKGSGNFVFVVRGRSSHAGRDFESGRNAVLAMCDAMQQVHQLNGQVADITLNIGRVEGGAALNVVPDLAIGRINARAKNPEQAEWIENELKKIAENVSLRDGIQCELHGYFSSPPKVFDAASVVIQKRIEHCSSMLNMPVKWQGSGGASDGNKFSAAGLPNVDTMGPIGGSIHSSDEFVFVDSLVPKAKLTALVLADFALGQ